MEISLIMKKLFVIPVIKQSISYFCVGGIAAIVEWVIFTLFTNVIGINYILATCLAFVFSTAANWILGRIWTFKDHEKYRDKQAKEIVLVFAVSAIGLVFNMGLMYLFVTVIGLDTSILKTISKVISTGIVFFWNFFIRKFIIYK